MNSEPSRLAITMDIDWASEAAVRRAFAFLDERGVTGTVFSTHPSNAGEARLGDWEVGLHPFFGIGSSHGGSASEVVSYVTGLPHNFKAFRCHMFEAGNTAYAAMLYAGFKVSSNVCTDLEVVTPFKNRFGMLEIPVFMEDGGFLFRQRATTDLRIFEDSLRKPGLKVILLHPMHIAVNTPDFGYMVDIKRSLDRKSWNALSDDDLSRLRSPKIGIADIVADILELADDLRVPLTSLGCVAAERSSQASQHA